MKDAVQLGEGWSLDHDGTGVPARVPGCVHTDLLAAGLIPDPFLGTNEHEIEWVGRRSWTYTRTLEAGQGPHERTDLVLDGIDTAARITLGGSRSPAPATCTARTASTSPAAPANCEWNSPRPTKRQPQYGS